MRKFYRFKLGSHIIMTREAQIPRLFLEDSLMIAGMMGMAGATIAFGIRGVLHRIVRRIRRSFVTSKAELPLVKGLLQQTFFRALMRPMTFAAIPIPERLM